MEILIESLILLLD